MNAVHVTDEEKEIGLIWSITTLNLLNKHFIATHTALSQEIIP